MVRFLHTADWQIGAALTQCGERAGAVRSVRLEAARRVIDLAKEQDVDFVLIAGDTFDGHDVDEVDVKRCVNLLDEIAPIPVFVLPGNHDPLVPGGVWDRSSWKQHRDHLNLLVRAKEITLNDEVALYPCPLKQKQSTQDPTAWIPSREPTDARVRIGLAHGALDIFPDTAGNFPIDLNRANEAGLDYLALGDWHGYMRKDRAIYPGTIEPSGFGEDDPGHVALVSIEEQGAKPKVEKHRVATLTWKTFEPEVHNLTDVQALEQDIQALGDIENLVLRVHPSFPDPVDEETVTALDTLKRELEEQVFVLRWNESAEPPLPSEADIELPEGILLRIDEDLDTILEGQIPEGPGQEFAGEDPETVALARRMLNRFAQEAAP